VKKTPKSTSHTVFPHQKNPSKALTNQPPPNQVYTETISIFY